MRVLIVLCALAALAYGSEEFFSKKMYGVPVPTSPTATIHTGIFHTQLDHFRPQDNRTFPITYHANFDYFQDDGPFYVYIKDFGDFSNQWIESGLMVDIARQTNAALFTFDQRFFGETRPTNSTSLEDLTFLTVEQILLDIAVFVSEARKFQGSNKKVILFGSGTGATLATWARKKYPHLVDGVWSSSGIYDLEISSYHQFDHLEDILEIAGNYTCRYRIENAFKTIEILAWLEEGAEIQEKLNLCRPVHTNSSGDISALFDSHVQFIIDYINKYHLRGAQDFCRDMNAYENDTLRAFSRWIGHVYGDEECFDHSYNGILERNKGSNWTDAGSVAGTRQRIYMQCIQLGLFAITDEYSWLPNKITEKYRLQKCIDILGDGYDAGMLEAANNELNVEFGSIYQRVTNVIYTNGYLDPWLYAGILFTEDPESIAINIQYHAKSSDQPSISGYDPSALVEAKNSIKYTITEWSAM